MEEGKKKKALSMATGMSIGMLLGAVVAAIAKWDMAICISVGTLFGIALGETAPNRKDQDTEKNK